MGLGDAINRLRQDTVRDELWDSVESHTQQRLQDLEHREDFAVAYDRAQALARWDRAVGLACTLEAPLTADWDVTSARRKQVVSTAEWLYGLLDTLPEDEPTPMPEPDNWVWRCDGCRMAGARIDRIPHAEGCPRPDGGHASRVKLDRLSVAPVRCAACGADPTTTPPESHDAGCPNDTGIYPPEPVAEVMVCPECRAGKHQNCPGQVMLGPAESLDCECAQGACAVPDAHS